MLLSSQNQLQQYVFLNEQKQHIAKYKKLNLRSVFQPIFDKNNQTIGVEALVRISNSEHQNVRPDHFFNSAEINLDDKINVERLSRLIHIRNFSNSRYRDLNLFLNVLPSAGEYYALEDRRINLLSQRLKALELRSDKVVMEVVESHAHDDTCLQKAMKRLSERGFKIAIDDYGMEASNSKRVELLRPNIIKIDRSLLLAYMNGHTEALLKGISLAREINAQIVIEGIETHKQYQTMVDLDVDLYQGYYLAMPQPLEMLELAPAN